MFSILSKVSDVGQVWGWGYGGEGQLGLGSRIRMVSSPSHVPCIESAAYGKDRTSAATKANTTSDVCRVVGSCVKAIACGGRHSAVITGQHFIPLLVFLSYSGDILQMCTFYFSRKEFSD